jgi:hypothetical protein
MTLYTASNDGDDDNDDSDGDDSNDDDDCNDGDDCNSDVRYSFSPGIQNSKQRNKHFNFRLSKGRRDNSYCMLYVCCKIVFFWMCSVLRPKAMIRRRELPLPAMMMMMMVNPLLMGLPCGIMASTCCVD